MALIRRGDVNRPLTIEEVDGNFDYLESLSSGSGATGPAGVTGPTGSQGATGPSGIGATPSLQQVTDEGNTTTTEIIANNGIQGDTDYSSYKIGSPYYNDMRQFVFRVTGDDTDFTVNNGCQIYMNPEEGLSLTRFDYDNSSNSNITFGTDTIYISAQSSTDFSNIVVYPYQVALRGGGSYDAYLKTTNFTTQREFEFPDNDGTLALLSDISGGATPSLEEVTNVGNETTNEILINNLKLKDNTSGQYANIFTDDNTITFVDSNGNSTFASSQTAFNIFQSALIQGTIDAGDITANRIYKLPNISGTVSLNNTITMQMTSDNNSVINKTSGNAFTFNNTAASWTSFLGAGGGNSIRFRIENPGVTRLAMEGTGFTSTNLSTNSQASINSDGTLLLDNTTSKRAILRQGPSQSATPITIDLPLVSGALPTIGYTAPSSATDTGTTGEVRVTSTFIYTCIATNTWVRGTMATW
jgi:hypothetical protein